MIMDNAHLNTNQAQSREQLFMMLNDLCVRSWDILTEDTVDLEDARQLSSYVTTMRILLSELAHVEDRLGREDRVTSSVVMLKDRFFELEGLAKEVRNSLDQLDRKTV
jgi:hypothetical protein